MVDIAKPLNGDFLLLETFTKEKGSARTVHILLPSQLHNSFRLGRGHEADIRVTDISVSRLHALIKWTKNGFMLEDNHSKFGTLVLERDRIQAGEKRVFQVGRTVITVAMQSIEPQSEKPSKLHVVKMVKVQQIFKDTGVMRVKDVDMEKGNEDEDEQAFDIPDENEA